jgi:hypothetical protein
MIRVKNENFAGIGVLLERKFLKKSDKNQLGRKKSLTHFLADEAVKVCGKPKSKNEWGILLASVKRVGKSGVFSILGQLKEGREAVDKLRLFIWLTRGIKKHSE